MKETAGCSGWLIILALLVIVEPVLYYFFGWLTGVILEWLIGDTVINGMNYLFNTTRFATDMLPAICGTLGVIGLFFKSTTSSSSQKN